MKTEIINKLENLEFKTHSSIKWPTYKLVNSNSFWFCCVYGTRGSGKSSAIFNLLEIERDIMLSGENKVYFFSPTKDDKVHAMIEKYPDNFVHIDGLDRGRLDEVLETVSAIVEDWYQKIKIYKLLKKLVDSKFNLKRLEPDEVKVLEDGNFYVEVDWEKFNHMYPVISTIIFDDLAGNPMLNGNNKEAKYFYSYALKHRHRPYHSNIFLLAQYSKSISRPVRSQANCVIQFNSVNYKNLIAMYEEYSSIFKHNIDNYKDLLKEIETRQGHNFMFLYYDKIKEVRINFNEAVRFD